jgi:hypothetical protein
LITSGSDKAQRFRKTANPSQWYFHMAPTVIPRAIAMKGLNINTTGVTNEESDMANVPGVATAVA